MPVYTYGDKLYQAGYERVERDDRLLDVFSKDTPEKGVELWIRWGEDTVDCIRIHNGKESTHNLERNILEDALLHNKRLPLS